MFLIDLFNELLKRFFVIFVDLDVCLFVCFLYLFIVLLVKFLN